MNSSENESESEEDSEDIQIEEEFESLYQKDSETDGFSIEEVE